MRLHQKSGSPFLFQPSLGRIFFFLLASNLFLAYVPAALEIKLWVGLVGLGLPLYFVFRGSRSGAPAAALETFPLPPPWVWVAFAALALAVRFHGLTTLAVWPHYDEGMTGYYAAGLSREWSWRLFYESSRTPPAYLWGLGLFFKMFGVSLDSLWGFPALLSALTVPIFFLAARQFFSKSGALLAALLMAFSFWPLFIGRFSLMSALVLPWECGTLWLLGIGLQKGRGKSAPAWALALGCATGLGFYTGLHWIAIAALLGVGMAWNLRRGSPKIFLGFLLPAVLLPLPLLLTALQPGSGSYFRHLWAFHQPLPGSDQLRVSLSYIASLFWGLPGDLFTFQPVFGGFLNPLLASLFFLGLVELFQNRSLTLYRWLLGGMAFLLLPGLLTKECEPLRILPVLPFLLVVAVLGCQKLLALLPEKRRLNALALLLSLSFGMDAFHLNDRYSRLWESPDNWRGYAKSWERKRAFDLLKVFREERGPGLVFSDFNPGLCDQTLSLADDAFNAVENPSLPPPEALWAALVTNVNYRPFLDRRFGPAQAFALSKPTAPPDGGWMLWVVPLTPSNRETFLRWRKADLALQGYRDENLSRPANESFLTLIPSLERAWPLFQGDPFLESCFGEKISELYVRESLLFPGEGASPWLEQGTEALQGALSGYPAAHLYHHLGNLWLLRQNEGEARKAFGLALRAPLNLTNSAQFLRKE